MTRASTLLIVFLLAPPTAAQASDTPPPDDAAPCRAELPDEMGMTRLTDVPLSVVARAMIPGIDGERMWVEPVRRSLTEGAEPVRAVVDCRGHAAVAEPAALDAEVVSTSSALPAFGPLGEPGSLRLWQRGDLPDGRQAVWLLTQLQDDAAQPNGVGFLAVARLQDRAVVIDAIRVWRGSLAEPIQLATYPLAGETVFVETQYWPRTGCGWSREQSIHTVRDGELRGAGTYSVSGSYNNCGECRVDYQVDPFFEGESLRLQHEVSWDVDCLESSDAAPYPPLDPIFESFQERYRLEGDRLVPEEAIACVPAPIVAGVELPAYTNCGISPF